MDFISFAIFAAFVAGAVYFVRRSRAKRGPGVPGDRPGGVGDDRAER